MDGLRVHSNVLTGNVPGYQLGQTLEKNIWMMVLEPRQTRSSLGRAAYGNGEHTSDSDDFCCLEDYVFAWRGVIVMTIGRVTEYLYWTMLYEM